MLLKLLLPFLVGLFKGHQAQDNPDSILNIKEILTKEISAQLFKIFAGIILTATIIIALAKLFTALYIYIEQFQNSLAFELLAFGLIILVSAGLLVLLFLGDKLKKKEISANTKQVDAQSLFLTFIEGVTQGFEKNRPLKTDPQSN